MVRAFTDKELLERVSKLEGFQGFPQSYWIIGMQGSTTNDMDDKFYLFFGETFVDVMTGTTNPGINSLLRFERMKLKGAFVWKTNEIYYDVWCSFDWNMKTKYLHKGKMRALRQCKPVKGFRDGNKNKIAEEIGKMISGIFGLNFHTNTYLKSNWSKLKSWLIGDWSWGCQVSNDPKKYHEKWIPLIYDNQVYTTYAILKQD
jgi:5-hydroxyisourate hydrolase-like protein (transthyretin family)